MKLKLEAIVIPVSDVDRAKDFYLNAGFRLDADFAVSEDYRVVQFTPPGSHTSIVFGTGLTSARPGSTEGLHLVVFDLEETRSDLIGLGIDVTEIFHDASGVFHHGGLEARLPGPHPEHPDYSSFAAFSDPDGNGWVLQQIRVRAPGR